MKFGRYSQGPANNPGTSSTFCEQNKAYLAFKYSVAQKREDGPRAGEKLIRVAHFQVITFPFLKSLHSLFHFLNLGNESIPLEQIPETFSSET